MKILLTENSFSGAHGSFRMFFDEIEYSLKTSGYTVYRADNVIQAASIYEQYRPDFSIGIGKYNFLVDEKLLCELYTTPHYQWILDNPLKLPCYSSKNFTPVFIDREFAELYKNWDFCVAPAFWGLASPKAAPNPDIPALSAQDKSAEMPDNVSHTALPAPGQAAPVP